MLHSLADTAALYAAALGVVCLAVAVRRRAPGRTLHLAVGVVEVAFVVVALGESVRWATGERVSQPVVHAVYLIVSVVIVPLIAGRTALVRPAGPASAPAPAGEAAVLAVALIAAAIVELRLLATG